MCLMTVAQTSNMNGDEIEQENQLTSSQDGRSDLLNQLNWESDEIEEWTYQNNFFIDPLRPIVKYDSNWHYSFDGLDQETCIPITRHNRRLYAVDIERELKDNMCLKTSNTQGEIQQEKQLTSCEDCSTDIHVRQFSVNYQNEGCTDQHNTLQHPAAISKHTFYRNCFSKTSRDQVNSLRPSSPSIHEIITWSSRKRLLRAAGGKFSKKLKEVKTKIGRIILEDGNEENGRIILEEMKHEEKQHIRQLFLMLLLIILIKNISENIKCRQTSCRKYPCLNSILYLLWQSGDVEVNPGPANSTTYRNWLYDVCPIVRKAIPGVPAESKTNKIWQQEPENWPPKKLYFNPRSKGHSVNNVEDLLINLLHCCDDTSKLSHDIGSEIDTWNAHRSKDNGKLLHLYRTRKCCMSIEKVNKSLKVLQSHLSSYNALVIEGNICIRISLSCQPAIDQQVITHNIYRSEASRKISSFLCRFLHGKDPERKCDHIWTLTPDGWPSHLRYYNPNNGGERCAENEDDMVVEALITLCEKKSIIFPTSYQDMVNAWQAGDQMLLSKLLTRHAAETDLKKAVMKLHKEGLLQEVDEHLRELGILVQCDGSTKNSKSQKRKMVNAMNKHETKRTKQSDHEDAVDTTVKELLPDCTIGQLLDNQSDSFLLDTIGQNIPDFLGDEADDVQFHWT